MKQITVISGKGGTGKTSITAAFASLSSSAVLADCDVDAADLHLILKPIIKETRDFHGLKIASIDKKTCIDCKKCMLHCQFQAIDNTITLHPKDCEGCGVCAYVCPVHAIKMIDRLSGVFYSSETRFGPLSHACLNAGEEASGKLVTAVRENAKKLALEYKKELIIIDGPPGIGCPVISAISGVDLVVIITEPTISAIHDLERILGVSKHFDIPAVVCINKYDLNEENTDKIISYCDQNSIQLIGKIPYDTIMTDAMIQEKTIIEFSDGVISENIISMWKILKNQLEM